MRYSGTDSPILSPVSINTANRVANRLERSVFLRIMYFFKFVANSIRLFFLTSSLKKHVFYN